MDRKLIEAYESLVPADRSIIDAILFTLANKEREIRNVCTELSRRLLKEQQDELLQVKS